ncbi:MAG TPA: 2Fe-2S iron-sulfur cluster-binding protein [Polyangiaceae bacterium]|nr:2Fe-2S iron-sulfur cluster-binding protein [Polyangiaceae bacterium]
MNSEQVVRLARRPLSHLLRSRLVAGLTSPRSIDDYLQLVDPSWSVEEVRARVVGIRSEAGQATSLLLKPNENWRGFRAGQFVQLSVTIDGVRHARCFSLSSAPEDGQPLRLTIKRIADGRVSGWTRERARVGDVVSLSQAQGQFVLPDPLPKKLFFLSGGCGITPILSMARHLAAVRHRGEVAWMHFAPREPMFEDELTTLANDLNLRLAVVPTRAEGAATEEPVRFSLARLEAFEPLWVDGLAFVCGPEGLSRTAMDLWSSRSASDRLHVEQFHFASAAIRLVAPAEAGSGGERYHLTFAKSGREGEGSRGVTLLEQAESAGLRPAHGCRMGICHTCTCRKVSGTVRNELTGESSSAADEEIRICVSTPLSDVTLDL